MDVLLDHLSNQIRTGCIEVGNPYISDDWGEWFGAPSPLAQTLSLGVARWLSMMGDVGISFDGISCVSKVPYDPERYLITAFL